jgi:hypothetical protein
MSFIASSDRNMRRTSLFGLLDQALGRLEEAGVCGFFGVAFFCAKATADSGEAATLAGVAALAGAGDLLPPADPASFNAFSFLLSLKLGLCFFRLGLPSAVFSFACLGAPAEALAEPASAVTLAGVFAMIETARER